MEHFHSESPVVSVIFCPAKCSRCKQGQKNWVTPILPWPFLPLPGLLDFFTHSESHSVSSGKSKISFTTIQGILYCHYAEMIWWKEKHFVYPHLLVGLISPPLLFHSCSFSSNFFKVLLQLQPHVLSVHTDQLFTAKCPLFLINILPHWAERGGEWFEKKIGSTINIRILFESFAF